MIDIFPENALYSQVCGDSARDKLLIITGNLILTTADLGLLRKREIKALSSHLALPRHKAAKRTTGFGTTNKKSAYDAQYQLSMKL